MGEADESGADEPAEGGDRVAPLSLGDAALLAAELLAARLLPSGGRALVLAGDPPELPGALEARAAVVERLPRGGPRPDAGSGFGLIVVDPSGQAPSDEELTELGRLLDGEGILICGGERSPDREARGLAAWAEGRGASLRHLALRPCAGYLLVADREAGGGEPLEAGITAPLEGSAGALPGIAIAGPDGVIGAPAALAALDASPAIGSLLRTELAWEARARAAEAELLALRRDASLARQALNETRARLERRTLRGAARELRDRLRPDGGMGSDR